MNPLYQYPPFWLHRLPAGAKLLVLAVLSIAAMQIASPWILAGATFGIGLLFVVPQYGIVRRLLGIAALWPVAAAIFVSQYFASGLEPALAMVLRLALMMLFADLVTLSTTMQAMMGAIEPLLRPLRFLGLQPRVYAFAISLTIRFVPLLLAQWQHMAEAWRARTGRRARIGLVAPYAASLLRMSDHVAEALDARGFGVRR